MRTVIADTSDQHCGSTVAVCPSVIRLDDGQEHRWSILQKWLWQRWELYWEEFDRVCRQHKADYRYGVYNGDLVDGDHHRTTQILNRNKAAQQQVAKAVFGIPGALKLDREFVVRGTAAHVGEAGQDEERFAWHLHDMGRPIVKQQETGNFSWYELELVTKCGARLFFKHHPPTYGTKPHTEQPAIMRIARETLDRFVDADRKPPLIASYGHIHYFGDSYAALKVRALVTPPWQFPTAYAHRRHSLASIGPGVGGFIIVIEDGEVRDVVKVHYKAKGAKAWTESN